VSIAQDLRIIDADPVQPCGSQDDENCRPALLRGLGFLIRRMPPYGGMTSWENIKCNCHLLSPSPLMPLGEGYDEANVIDESGRSFIY